MRAGLKTGAAPRPQPFRRPQRKVEDRVILIEQEPFGCGFDVRIDPPVPGGGHHHREFGTREAAYGHADKLRTQLRLSIIDQSGGAA